MQLYRIADAAKFLGVSAQTLRRWDDKGTFKPLGRSEGGQRLYTRGQLDAKQAGAPSAPPSTCRELIPVETPAVLKAGPSQAAKDRAKAYRKAKRDMIVGNILTRDSQRNSCRGKDRVAKLIDGDQVLDAYNYRCGNAWKWKRPPTLQEAQETATLLQDASNEYAAAHGHHRLDTLLGFWDRGSERKPDLWDELCSPLGLMVEKGRGIQAAEVRYWAREWVYQKQGPDTPGWAGYKRPMYGEEGYEAAWCEIYLRIAYAWRLCDLLKRGL